MDENPAAREKVMEMPHRLLQLPHIVAMAVDQLDAAPREAMEIEGAVRPAVQRQDACDARTAQLIEPAGVVHITDRDIACNPLQDRTP